MIFSSNVDKTDNNSDNSDIGFIHNVDYSYGENRSKNSLLLIGSSACLSIRLPRSSIGQEEKSGLVVKIDSWNSELQRGVDHTIATAELNENLDLLESHI